uniref:Uncharacterized protein n=1 Tax=Rhizobium phage IG49 TaxID=3129228 RepID=A0AAU8HZI4_9CAUD
MSAVHASVNVIDILEKFTGLLDNSAKERMQILIDNSSIPEELVSRESSSNAVILTVYDIDA